MLSHNEQGNCVSAEAYEKFDDVCPDHDEPRGDCNECQPCRACEAVGRSIDTVEPCA